MDRQNVFNPKNLAATLWLVTANDLKTFVLPQTMYGTSLALAKPLLAMSPAVDWWSILARTPYVFAWVWINTLVFDLANQRLPDSVLEDQLNKPWRPIPAGRLDQNQARILLLLAIPGTLCLTYLGIGATEETMLLFCLTWIYNDLGASDDNFLVRALVTTVAYIVYTSGAMRVSCDDPSWTIENRHVVAWLATLGLAIFTTIHVQDLRDVKGDLARGRKTAPIVLGERPTRRFLACAIIFWSGVIPLYLRSSMWLLVAMLGIGSMIATQILSARNNAWDRMSWKLWCYWLSLLYMLPLGKVVAGASPM